MAHSGFAIRYCLLADSPLILDLLFLHNFTISEEDLKRLLMKVQEKSKAIGLYLNIKKTKVMTTEDLIEFKIGDEEVEIISDFNYLGVLKEREGGCEREIKRRLGMGRSTMAKLGYIMKDKNIYNKTKVDLTEILVFPIATYGSESWTIKKGGRKRIDVFELWC